ncbi:MAG TPA: stage IV sporulation protein A [Clostridiaceae bacterium]|nr:stage IV sporulation protein A [Clostridiaceae bacterium]
MELGCVNISINLAEDLFYKILTEISGVEIANEGDLFSTITNLASTKKEYDKIAYALEEVKAKGYGIVSPSMDELILDEPEMVKQGSRFGVKLKAKAPSIHIVRPKQIHSFSDSDNSNPSFKHIYTFIWYSPIFST